MRSVMVAAAEEDAAVRCLMTLCAATGRAQSLDLDSDGTSAGMEQP